MPEHDTPADRSGTDGDLAVVPGGPPTRRPQGCCRPQNHPQGYGADWGFFTDWCVAAGYTSLPAGADTVIAFLEENPAAPATWARRVAAISYMHTTQGYPSPGRHPAVVDMIRAAAGKPALDPTARRLPPGQLAAVLRGIPSHGWPAGLMGRRDRLLLVLAHAAGLTHGRLHELRVGNLTVDDGDLLIDAGSGADPVTLPAVGASDVCPGCVWLRWGRVLSLAARYPGVRVLRDALHRTHPLTPGSAHLCRTERPGIGPEGPVLLAADQYGYLTAHHPLSTRSISRILTAHATGRPPTYRFPGPTPIGHAGPGAAAVHTTGTPTGPDRGAEPRRLSGRAGPPTRRPGPARRTRRHLRRPRRSDRRGHHGRGNPGPQRAGWLSSVSRDLPTGADPRDRPRSVRARRYPAACAVQATQATYS